MGYQVYFLDLTYRPKPNGRKIKVSVAKSKEEFKNTTVEELKGKIVTEMIRLDSGSERFCKLTTSLL